jgi:hypothetical protein
VAAAMKAVAHTEPEVLAPVPSKPAGQLRCSTAPGHCMGRSRAPKAAECLSVKSLGCHVSAPLHTADAAAACSMHDLSVRGLVRLGCPDLV